MSVCRYKGIQLVADGLDSYGLKYNVDSVQDLETLNVSFSIDCGPNVTMRFVNSDDGNDISMRIIKLIGGIPENKRSRVIDVCNDICKQNRWLKFYVDDDGDLIVSYTFPLMCSDDCVGETAATLVALTKRILDKCYKDILKAIYAD